MKENVAIKNRIIRDIKNLFEQEEDYNKPVREVIFTEKVISNVKLMVIKIKPYQSKNTLMKLNHTFN